MTQEDKSLLLKDICARLPYGVIVVTPKGNGHLCSINQTIFGNEYGINIKATQMDYFNDRDCDIKPYLRPISSITNEEKEELGNFVAANMFASQNKNPLFQLAVEALYGDFFNKHHIDYRGLIPKGLALEAPENMYLKSK